MSAGLARRRALRAAAKRLDLPSPNPSLLEAAFTHESYASEHARDTKPPSYERLEFLGDAILGAVVAAALYERYPDRSEGRLSRMRASLVSKTALARSAELLGLGDLVLFGRGETAAGGARRPSVLAAVFEALVGVAFVSGGLAAAEKFIARHHLAHARDAERTDPKTELQEYIQARYKKVPHYALVAQSGPPHARIFTITVDVGGEILGKGEGTTKKQSEAAAAREALTKLGKPRKQL